PSQAAPAGQLAIVEWQRARAGRSPKGEDAGTFGVRLAVDLPPGVSFRLRRQHPVVDGIYLGLPPRHVKGGTRKGMPSEGQVAPGRLPLLGEPVIHFEAPHGLLYRTALRGLAVPSRLLTAHQHPDTIAAGGAGDAAPQFVQQV